MPTSLLAQRLRLLGNGDVRPDGDCLPPLAADLASYLDCQVAVDIAGDNSSTLAGQGERDRLANSLPFSKEVIKWQR